MLRSRFLTRLSVLMTALAGVTAMIVAVEPCQDSPQETDCTTECKVSNQDCSFYSGSSTICYQSFKTIQYAAGKTWNCNKSIGQDTKKRCTKKTNEVGGTTYALAPCVLNQPCFWDSTAPGGGACRNSNSSQWCQSTYYDVANCP